MKESELYQPKNANKAPICALCVSAHHDDTEIMAVAPALEFFGNPEGSFAAVVLTDGAGSARSGKFAAVTNEEMIGIRNEEQKKAAEVGNYHALWLLNFTSAEVRSVHPEAVRGVAKILLENRPKTLYVHNPFDKHPTHRGALLVALAALDAVRSEYVPEKVLAGEVWRDLDWIPDEYRVVRAVDGNPELSMSLLTVFESQIAGGKAYDLAATGRRFAHATFSESHSVDNAAQLAYFCDITDVATGKIALDKFCSKVLGDFAAEVSTYYGK